MSRISEVCLTNGHEVRAAALLLGTTPGFVCETCGGWATMRRSDFAAQFGKTFGEFRRDDLNAVPRKIVTATSRALLMELPRGGIVIRGRRRGVSGSASDRRRYRRTLQLEKAGAQP